MGHFLLSVQRRPRIPLKTPRTPKKTNVNTFYQGFMHYQCISHLNLPVSDGSVAVRFECVPFH